MEFYLKIAATCAVILYIMCDTSALETYLKSIFKFFGKKNDIVNPDNEMGLPLIARWRMKNPNSFFADLIECPICLGVWLAAITSVFVFGFNILAIGSSIFLTWVFYFFLRYIVSVINSNESKDSGKV